MSKRIKETTLPADFLDGQILYGKDVNKIITVLREAVNFNKYDIDKAYLGKMSDYVFVDMVDLAEYETDSVTDGTLAIVLRGNTGGAATGAGDTVVLFKWNGSNWAYVDDAIGISHMWELYLEYEGRLEDVEIGLPTKARKPDDIGNLNFDTAYILKHSNGEESQVKIGHTERIDLGSANAVVRRNNEGNVSTTEATADQHAVPKSQMEDYVTAGLATKAKKPTNIGDANFDTLYVLDKNGNETQAKVGHTIVDAGNAVVKRGSSGHVYTPNALSDSQATPKGQVDSLISTHNTSETAHLYIRELIQTLQQEIARLDGKGKSWGMIDKTQSELLAMSWGERTNYINSYLENKYPNYTRETGNLIYTKTVVGENEHEWEYNHDAGDWLDNGAWTIEKASNSEFGLIKGNAYISIVSGLAQVLKSDFAGGLGTSETYLNYAQVKAAIDELDNIYRKTAVYNKTEIDALFNQLKSIYGWKDTFIGTYNNNGGSNIILGTAIADYDYIYVEIYDLSALGETFVYYGKLKDIEGETAIGNYVITKLDGNYTITGFGSNDYANVYGVKMIKTDADKIAYDNTTSELDAENLQEAIDELVVNKVDKVTGYGLSKNDYTDNEKLKVSKLVIDGAGTKALYDDGTYKTVSDSAQEIIDARQGEVTLGANITKIKSQLEQTATKEELTLKRDKTELIELEDVGSTLVEAITGGTTVSLLSVPKRKSVTPFETGFYRIGKNIFNPAEATPGHSVSDSTGVLYANTLTTASGYIAVEPNTAYTRSYDGRTAFYDANKVYISGHNDGTGQTKTITTPSNAYYMRCTIANVLFAMFQVELGGQQTTYRPFNPQIPKKELDVFPITERDLAHHSIPAYKMQFFETGKNLFNVAELVEDVVVNIDNGKIDTDIHNLYSATGLIPVEPNTQYTRSYDGRTAYYDSGMVFIGSHYDNTSETKTITTPNNAYYMRCTILKTVLPTYQIELGNTITEYEPYFQKLKSKYLPANEQFGNEQVNLFTNVSTSGDSAVLNVENFNTLKLDITHSSRCKVYLYGSNDNINWTLLKSKSQATSKVDTIIYNSGEFIADVTTYKYAKAYVVVANYEGIYITATAYLLVGYPQTYELETVAKKSLIPQIIKPNYAKINTGQLMFSAGATEDTIYAIISGVARISTDGGATFSTLFDFADGASGVQIHYIKEDDTLVCTRSDGSIWKSDVAKTTFTKVHQMETPNMANGYLFGFNHYDNVVVIAEYGDAGLYPNNPNKVYVSLDYGVTFTKKFAGPTDRVFHCHDVLYDPYSQIIWLTSGDSFASSNIYYSLDFGDTWLKVYEDGNCPSQWTSMAVLPNCVLFMTDAKDVGVWRWDRLNEPITDNTKIEVVHAYEIKNDYVGDELVASTAGMTYGGGAVAYFGFGFFPNHVPEIPCKIWGTSDGHTFYEIWDSGTLPISTGGSTGVFGCDVTVGGNILATYVSAEGDPTGYYLLKIDNPNWVS